VDGLSGLFDAPQQQQPPPPPPPQQQRQQGSTRLGPMGGAIESGRSIPMRGPASTRGPPPSTASTTRTPSQAKSSTPQQKQLHISGQGITALNQLENDILSVVKSLPNPSVANETGDGDDEDGNDILLILDQPDLILAMTPGVDANDMSEWVLGLQQVRLFPSHQLLHRLKAYDIIGNSMSIQR
jgi:elongator complex protein 6